MKKNLFETLFVFWSRHPGKLHRLNFKWKEYKENWTFQWFDFEVRHTIAYTCKFGLILVKHNKSITTMQPSLVADTKPFFQRTMSVEQWKKNNINYHTQPLRRAWKARREAIEDVECGRTETRRRSFVANKNWIVCVFIFACQLSQRLASNQSKLISTTFFSNTISFFFLLSFLHFLVPLKRAMFDSFKPKKEIGRAFRNFKRHFDAKISI